MSEWLEPGASWSKGEMARWRSARERRLRTLVWLLLATFLFTSLPPAALAAPGPARPQAAPVAPRQVGESLDVDPLLSKVLRQQGHSLDRPDYLPSAAASHFPDPLVVAAAPDKSPPGKAEPPAWAQVSPTPEKFKNARPTREEEDEPGQTEAPRHSAKPSQNKFALAWLVPGTPDREIPRFDWSRQTHPVGRFYEMPADARVAYTNDHLVWFKTAIPLSNPAQADKTIWDFYSPNPASNRNSRGAAASYVASYTSQGEFASSFGSRHTITLKVYDRKQLTGRTLKPVTAAGHLEELKLFCGLAARDVGEWRVTVRHGQSETEHTFTVQPPPSLTDAWSRRLGGTYQAAETEPKVVSYVSDEWTMHRATYSLASQLEEREAEDDEDRERAQRLKKCFHVRWKFKAPPGTKFNKSKYHTYASVDLKYRTDGKKRHHTLVKVYDPAYPKGRVVKDEEGEGALEELSLEYGTGLPAPGSWSFEEKVQGQSKRTPIEVRALRTAVEEPAVLYADNEDLPYTLKVNTEPASWQPEQLNWSLALRDVDTGQVLRTYTGSLSEASTNAHEFVQSWDGKDDNGAPVAYGTSVVPDFAVSLPPQTFAAAARRAPIRLTAQPVNQANLSQALSGANATAQRRQQLEAAVTQQSVLAAASETLELFALEISGGTTGPTSDIPARFIVDFSNLVPGAPVSVAVRAPGTHCSTVTYALAMDGTALLSTGALTAGQQSANVTLHPSSEPHEFTVNCTVLPGGCAPWDPFVGSWAVYLLVSFDPEQTSGPITGDDGLSSVERSGSPLFPSGVWDAEDLGGAVPLLVERGSGRYLHMATDMKLATRGFPIVISRYHLSALEGYKPYFGWLWSFQRQLRFTDVRINGNPRTLITHVLPDGSEDSYHDAIQGFNPKRPDITSKLNTTGSEWVIETKSHHKYFFKRAPFPGKFAHLIREEDQNGNRVSYLWNEAGTQLQEIRGPVGDQAVTVGYNPQGLIERFEDWTGRAVTYTYEPRGYLNLDRVLTRVSEPGGVATTYNYTDAGTPGTPGIPRYTLQSITPPSGQQVTIAPQTTVRGTLKELTSRTGERTTYERAVGGGPVVLTSHAPVPGNPTQAWRLTLDDKMRVRTSTDPKGGLEQYDYDVAHNLRFLINAANQRTTMTYDARHNLETITDNQGRTTTLRWVDDDLVSVTDALGRATVLRYDARHNLERIDDPAGHFETMDYTPFGRLQKHTDGENHSWTFGYNDDGYLNSRTAPPGDNLPAATWNFGVDRLGRRLSMTDPRNNTWGYTWDVRDRLTHLTVPPVTAQFQQTSLSAANIVNVYDNNDLLRSRTDLDGRTTSYDYDNSLRLIRVHEPGAPRPIVLDYDARSNLVKFTNPRNHATTYIYDEKNRRTSTTYPAGGGQETFVYDALDNLREWHKGNGTTVTYAYETALNRLSRIECQETGDDIWFTYDALNRVETMTDPSGPTTYSYTRDYLLESVTRNRGKLLYGYDKADRLLTIRDPEDQVTTYSWTDRDELRSATLGEGGALPSPLPSPSPVSEPSPEPSPSPSDEGPPAGIVAAAHRLAANLAAGPPVVVSYRYDLAGNPVSTLLPNGIEGLSTFDERNRFIRRQYVRSTQPLLTLNYRFNQFGQRELAQQTTSRGLVTNTYRYNTRRALDRSERRTAGGAPVVTTYEQDGNQNRQTVNAEVYVNDPSDRLQNTASTTFGHNGSGQMTSAATAGGDTYTFSYNYVDQVKTVVQAGVAGSFEYIYDGNQQRVEKRSSETRTHYLWSGDEVFKEYRGVPGEGVTPHAQYLMGQGREGIKTADGWHYYLKDHLSSTVLLTDSSGTVAAEYSYTDFGVATQHAGSTALYNPYLFTGQQYDPETGLYSLRARYYSPKFGRFTSRDPIGYQAGANLFNYCDGDPINCSDPSGLEETIEEASARAGRFADFVDYSIIMFGVAQELIPGGQSTGTGTLAFGLSRVAARRGLVGLATAEYGLRHTAGAMQEPPNLSVLFRQGGGSSARTEAAENLSKMGLSGVNLAGRSYNSGKKALEKAGFVLREVTDTGRKVFQNLKTKAQVFFDSGEALVGRQRNHWHIEDAAGNPYGRTGRPVPGSSNKAHIPARR